MSSKNDVKSLFDKEVYHLFLIKIFKSSIISFTFGNDGLKFEIDLRLKANKIWSWNSVSGWVVCVFEILPGSSGRTLLNSFCNWLKNNALSSLLKDLKWDEPSFVRRINPVAESN